MIIVSCFRRILNWHFENKKKKKNNLDSITIDGICRDFQLPILYGHEFVNLTDTLPGRILWRMEILQSRKQAADIKQNVLFHEDYLTEWSSAIRRRVTVPIVPRIKHPLDFLYLKTVTWCRTSCNHLVRHRHLGEIQCIHNVLVYHLGYVNSIF